MDYATFCPVRKPPLLAMGFDIFPEGAEKWDCDPGCKLMSIYDCTSSVAKVTLRLHSRALFLWEVLV